MHALPARQRHRSLAAVLALAVVLLGGCSTQRTLRIESDPPGAHVWVNGALQPTRTPVEIPFVHYGRFDVRMEKEGYESLATELHVPTQLDGYPLIDLPLEMLTRGRRFREVVRLRPLPAAPTEADVQAVMERARGLRERTRRAVREPQTPGRQAPAVLRP